jgi:hypothetical protein
MERAGTSMNQSMLIAVYAKFIPIYAVESFVLFPFTGDYLNLEMFKMFYLLGV